MAFSSSRMQVLLCVAAGYFGLVEKRPRWLAVLPVALALVVGRG